MSTTPLTHHEILALVEPFARCGRHVDLSASDRLARRLVFKSVEHRAATPGAPPLRETLELESYGTGTFRLTRLLTRADDGLQATLQALGDDPAALLAQFASVEPGRHFRCGPGYGIATSYAYDWIGAPPPAVTQAREPNLVRGQLQVGDLQMTLGISTVRGASADLALLPRGAARPALPEDLLAVLGWNWARLIRDAAGWRSKLRVPGPGPARNRALEHALEQAGQHLARVLAEPPGRFHDRFVAARWGVVFRRALPTLTTLVLLATAGLLPVFNVVRDQGLWTLLHYGAIAALVASFTAQELSQFEIPPLPRRSKAPAWDAPPPAARAGATRA